jgi:hypothetical protein
VAAGFHVNCSSYRAPFDANPKQDSQGYYDIFPAPAIFLVQLQYGVGFYPSLATLHIEYKPSAGAEGELEVRDCTLRGGAVEYPIVVDGLSSTVSLTPKSTIWNDTVIGPPDQIAPENNGQTSTYGGLFLAIANQINTNITMEFGGGIGWAFGSSQSQASISYARNVSAGLGPDIYCKSLYMPIDVTDDGLFDMACGQLRLSCTAGFSRPPADDDLQSPTQRRTSSKTSDNSCFALR